jgi:hypothetical protein
MEIIGALIIALATGICLIALFNVLAALFPTRIEHTRHAAETSMVRAFFLGLVNFLFLGALMLGFIALGENIHRVFFIPAIFFLGVVSVGVTLGLGGIVQMTGNRMFPEKSALHRTTWGTSALYLACLTPFIGWFGVFIYIGLLGLGSFILSFFRKEPKISAFPED